MEQYLITEHLTANLIAYESLLNAEIINATAACVSGNLDHYYATVLEFMPIDLIGEC
jgi:hypothetical protein